MSESEKNSVNKKLRTFIGKFKIFFHEKKQKNSRFRNHCQQQKQQLTPLLLNYSQFSSKAFSASRRWSRSMCYSMIESPSCPMKCCRDCSAELIELY